MDICWLRKAALYLRFYAFQQSNNWETTMRTIPSRNDLALSACTLGTGLVFLDSTVINVSLPAIQETFRAGLAMQQWLVAAYLLTLAASTMIGGSLSDLFGRRKILLCGTALLGITSLICAIATSPTMLIIGRAGQGIAGGLLVPSALAIISVIFQGNERSRAIGTWTAWSTIIGASGPFLAGSLLNVASWRWIFVLNLPLVIMTFMLIRHAISSDAIQQTKWRIDVPGATFCALGFAGSAFALIEQPIYGWGHPRIIVPLLAGVICLVVFVLIESRNPHPMMPLNLFANRTFTMSNIIGLMLYAGLGGSFFFIVLFVQQVQGYDPLEAGVALLPMTVVMSVLTQRFGALMNVIGSRFLLSVGALIASGGLLLLLRIDQNPDYFGTLLPGLLTLGFGIAMTNAPLIAVSLNAVPQKDIGIASGINNAISRIATLIAIGVFGIAVSTSFAATVDQRVGDQPLSNAARTVITTAEAQPFAVIDFKDVPEPERNVLSSAMNDATLISFRLVIWLAAGLIVVSGLIAIVGIPSLAQARDSTLPVAHHDVMGVIGALIPHHASTSRETISTNTS
jgi:EmrB/QacA subfamily drug resistance transporter